MDVGIVAGYLPLNQLLVAKHLKYGEFLGDIAYKYLVRGQVAYYGRVAGCDVAPYYEGNIHALLQVAAVSVGFKLNAILASLSEPERRYSLA